MKKLITTLSATALALSFSSVMAAPGNGQAIGQDEAALARTICSDAGRGNGAEGIGMTPENNDLDPGGSPYAPNNGGDFADSPEQNSTPGFLKRSLRVGGCGVSF